MSNFVNVNTYGKKQSYKRLTCLALMLTASVFTPSTTIHAQEDIEFAYNFVLSGIDVQGGNTFQDSSAFELIKNKHIGSEVNLSIADQIRDEIHNYYKTQNVEGVNITVMLPPAGSRIISIVINEPFAEVEGKAEEPPTEFTKITAINFTGTVSIDAEPILAIADKLVDKTYNDTAVERLTNGIQNIYATNESLNASLSQPLFDKTTGEIFINIEEEEVVKASVKAETAPTVKVKAPAAKPKVEEKPKAKPQPKAKTKPVVKTEPAKLYEVQKGIFLKSPQPKGWKPAAWLEKALSGKPVQKVKPKVKPTPKKVESKAKKAESNVRVRESHAILLNTPKAEKKTTNPAPTVKKKQSEQPNPLKDNKSSKKQVESLTPIENPEVFEPEVAASTFTKINNNLTLVERNDDNLLILELIVDDMTRSEGIGTYLNYDTDELLIPMGELQDALAFSLDIKPEQGTASGFFISPENTFELDISQQSITINGHKQPWPQKGIEASYEDIYVQPEILETWFPIKLDLHYGEQRLIAQTTQELPYQAFAKRRGIWEQMKQQNEAPKIDAPTHTLKERMFSNPIVYTALSSTLSQSEDGATASNNNINVQATGDLLKATGHITGNINYNSGNAPEVTDVKATLTKLDPKGEMLGTLGAKQIEFGDVDFQAQPLLATNTSGRGVFLTNRDITAIRDPENFVLTGNAPAGWDVEIYQNGLLLDFQTVADNGAYEFTTLPLRTGNNTFDIKLFGPNGERDEFSESYYLGSGVVKQGDFNYDFIATESSGSLIPTDDEENDEDGIISLNTQYGLFKNFSLLTGLYTGPLGDDDENGQAITLGARTALYETDIQFDYLKQSDDGESYQTILRRRLGPRTDIAVNFKENTGFDAADNDIKSEHGASLSHTFDFDKIPDVQTRLEYDVEEDLGGYKTQNYKARVGGSLRGVSLSNEIAASHIERSDTDTYNGVFTASGRAQHFDYRGRINYKTVKDAGIEQASLRVNGQMLKNMSFNSSVTQYFDEGPSLANIDTGFNWKLPKADFGFSVGGDTDGNFNTGFNISSYWTPSANGYTPMSSQNAGYGQVQVGLRAFLDDNNNNTYDYGEETLEGVVFKYTKRGRIARTGEDGYAILTGLQPYQENLVNVDMLSIPDIYIKPVNERVQIVGKPHQQGYVDFPLRLEGEVGGLLQIQTHTGLLPLSGIRLQLTEQTNQTTKETVSEFDGYYMFTGVPMGMYKLSLNEADLNLAKYNYHLESLPEREVTLTTEEPFVDGLEITIMSREEKPEDMIQNSLENMIKEDL